LVNVINAVGFHTTHPDQPHDNDMADDPKKKSPQTVSKRERGDVETELGLCHRK